MMNAFMTYVWRIHIVITLLEDTLAPACLVLKEFLNAMVIIFLLLFATTSINIY